MTRGSRFLILISRLLGVTVLSVLALAIAFEIYLRRAGYLQAQPANYPCIAGDPVLNHVFQSNCEAKAGAEALKTFKDVTYRTNKLGFRGPEPSAGRKTLLVLGDSYTEGFGLEENETFPAVLDRELATQKLNGWQVLNGGILGFSPALYPAYFDRYFLTLKPDFVLLNLDFTDFSDDPYFLQIADFDVLNRPVAFPGRDVFPQWSLSFVYSNKSALVRFIHQEINQWASIARRDEAQWRMDQWIHQKNDELIPDAELAPQGLQGCAKAIKAVAKHILVLKSRVEAVGGKLGIHMYPPGYLVKQYPNQPQSISFVQIWDQKNRKDFSWACGIGPNVIPLMKSFSQKNRIPFFDSFPPVMSHQRKQDLYFEKDAHWNEAGVHFVVKSLTPQLLAELREFGRPHKK